MVDTGRSGRAYRRWPTRTGHGFPRGQLPAHELATVKLRSTCFHEFCSLSPGTVDSNWVVGATLEKKLIPLPLTLALGAFLNHRKNKFQCGFGITIG